MLRIGLALVLLAAPCAAQEPAAPVPVQGYELVRTWPHDPGAFTQGLAWADGDLLESTGRSPSSVRRTRLDDGRVLHQRTLEPALFGEGLTQIGDRVFTLTWKDGRGFVWSADDLRPLGEFAYEGEGWGLADDERRLILSDGTPELRFLDPETFAEIGRVSVTLQGRPLHQINELEWVDGEILANVWQTDFLVRIDPASGRVTGLVDLRGLLPDREGMDPADDVLNGIAWDPEGRRLFVTGKKWPTVFEIRLTAPQDPADRAGG